MNITKSDIEKWNDLDTYMYGRAKNIIEVIRNYQLDKDLRWFNSIDRITIDNEKSVVDIEFTECCRGYYERGNYVSFPVEWFESDCDYKVKIFEKYHYTPEDD